MKSDIVISREATLLPITRVAAKLGIPATAVDQFGKYKAKIHHFGRRRGRLILVTAINPTKFGEGKTTVSIGLADGLCALDKRAVLALREPSLGPVFGVKGGATGGGYAQVAPMSDINLHFTGDLHAITAANNLLSAMIDNHIHWGNALGIRSVTWRRCLDVNDRALRNVQVGLGGGTNGVPRHDGFDITAASEVMAVLTLASDIDDLCARLGRIIIGFDHDDRPVTASQIGAHQAMAILLADALRPNLVQTLEGTPALIHGGPFANIAHGCNSIIATRMALSLADYVVTEAGFGADLGAEKFLDIKCRVAQLQPACVVVVATCRALKAAGGASDVVVEDLDALERGMANLRKHISNMTSVFGLRTVVAINRFGTDTDAEIASIMRSCAALGVPAECITSFAEGSAGGTALAGAVVRASAHPPRLRFCYDHTDPIEAKMHAIATRIYGATGVLWTDRARESLQRIQALGMSDLPICVAKTQYSLSDDPKLIGCPSDFQITVRDLQLRAGAGFVVAVCGDILLMPGLSRVTNAEGMHLASDGTISGLF